MKIYPYYHRRRCSPMTLVSGSIRFMRIFAGFPGKGALNDSGVIKNMDLQGFQTLRLRHLKKWGQRCLVPCRLSTDPKIRDLEWRIWSFYVKFSLYYYELTLRILLADFDSITYLFTVESVYIRVTSGDVRSGVADRDSQNIGILRIFHRRYIVGTLTNKANISI